SAWSADAVAISAPVTPRRAQAGDSAQPTLPPARWAARRRRRGGWASARGRRGRGVGRSWRARRRRGRRYRPSALREAHGAEPTAPQGTRAGVLFEVPHRTAVGIDHRTGVVAVSSPVYRDLAHLQGGLRLQRSQCIARKPPARTNARVFAAR